MIIKTNRNFKLPDFSKVNFKKFHLIYSFDPIKESKELQQTKLWLTLNTANLLTNITQNNSGKIQIFNNQNVNIIKHKIFSFTNRLIFQFLIVFIRWIQTWMKHLLLF